MSPAFSGASEIFFDAQTLSQTNEQIEVLCLSSQGTMENTDNHEEMSAVFSPSTTISLQHSTMLSATEASIRENRQSIKSISGLHHLLAPVHDALHSHRRAVTVNHQGTHKDIIKEIVQCIDKGYHPICWLSGPAGSGKSAISQMVADWYTVKGRLCGSFFFLRGSGNQSSIVHLIPTLAYELSISIPETLPVLQAVMKHEPAIIHQPLNYQLKKLITKPILAARGGILNRLRYRKPVVIVIDALDECDDRDLIVQFIGVIIETFKENPRLPLRLMMTSRVEEHICKKLKTSCSTVYQLSV
jgi:hypothetical protein